MTPNQFGQLGTSVAWLLFIITFIWARRRQPGRASPAQVLARDRMAWIGFLLQGCGFGLVWGWRRPVDSSLFPASVSTAWALNVLAVILAALGVWLAVSAVRAMGRMWTIEARVLVDHELITGGAFALVRHPIYLALLLLLLSVGIIVSVDRALLTGAVVFVIGTRLRAEREERLLRAKFGAGYERYMAEVPQLFPRWTSRRKSPRAR